LVDWKNVKNNLKRIIDVVQSNPILDELAQSGINMIPYAGSVLVNYYNKYKDSKDVDVRQDILNTLNVMNSMDTKMLESFCKRIENNTDEILKNRKFLVTLLDNTTEILKEQKITNIKLGQAHLERQEIKNEVKNINQNLTEKTDSLENSIQQTNQKLEYLIQNQVLVLQEIGIQPLLKDNKKLEISDEDKSKIEDNDSEIIKLHEQLNEEKSEIALDETFGILQSNYDIVNGNIGKGQALLDKVIHEHPDNEIAKQNLNFAIKKRDKFSLDAYNIREFDLDEFGREGINLKIIAEKISDYQKKRKFNTNILGGIGGYRVVAINEDPETGKPTALDFVFDEEINIFGQSNKFKVYISIGSLKKGLAKNYFTNVKKAFTFGKNFDETWAEERAKIMNYVYEILFYDELELLTDDGKKIVLESRLNRLAEEYEDELSVKKAKKKINKLEKESSTSSTIENNTSKAQKTIERSETIEKITESIKQKRFEDARQLLQSLYLQID